MSKRIILHLGAPKCGSSALQAHLSGGGGAQATLPEQTRYGILRARRGLVTSGAEIGKGAERSPFGYESSHSFNQLPDSNEFLSGLRDDFVKFFSEYDTLVLSCEGWVNQPHNARKYLECVPDGVAVVSLVWVRPPVDFANSAWWQWGAWSGKTLSEFLQDSNPGGLWSHRIREWAAQSDSLKVIPLSGGDVVEDFRNVTGMFPPGDTSNIPKPVNRSLPASILRLYQRHSELRPGPHVSRNDFILEKFVEGDKTPWVVGMEMAEEIIEVSKSSIESLREYIPQEYLSRIDSNEKWWSTESYSSKTVEPWRLQEARDPIVDDLAAQLAHSVVDLYLENLRLKSGR